jgi:hypothetical protein
MFEFTAELSPWIRVERTGETSLDKLSLIPFSKLLHGPAPKPLQFSDIEFWPLASSPKYPDAQWLKSVEQRIVASVPPPGYEVENDGTWLSQSVANAAVDFLGKVADSFTNEPYLYSSPSGDLVAEFQESKGRLTCIISPDSATIFAMIAEKPVTKTYSPVDWTMNRMKPLLDQILTTPESKNGTVGR